MFEKGCGVDDRTDSLLRREAADEEEAFTLTLPRTRVRADEIVFDVDPIGREPAFGQLAGGEIREGDERVDIPPAGPDAMGGHQRRDRKRLEPRPAVARMQHRWPRHGPTDAVLARPSVSERVSLRGT